MPFLAPVVAAIAASAFLTQVAIAVVTTAAAFGLSYAARALRGDQEVKQPVGGVRGELTGGEDDPQSFLLGEWATSGSLKYAGTWGENDDTPNAYLTLVIQLADLPVESLEGIIVDGERVTSLGMGELDSRGIPISEYREGSDDDHLWYFFHDGTQTDADDFLVDKFGTDPDRPWTEDAVGPGCPYIVMTMELNPELFSGVPDFKFVLKGTKFYDIRLDTTAGGSGAHRWNDQSTWEWTDNPVVMIYNIIRGMSYEGDWFYGSQNFQGADRRLPFDVWSLAMNECDEEVNKKGGGTEKRYVAGAEVLVDMPAADTIESLLTACGGRLFEMGGVYKIHVGPPNPSAVSITDQGLLSTEGQSFSPFYGLADTINGIAGSYISPNLWDWKSLPPLIDTDLEDEDGGRRLLADPQFGTVSSKSQAQRLRKAALKEARRARRHTIPGPPELWQLEPGDFIDWTSDRNGYTEKAFRIDGMRDLPNACVLLDITEVNSADYDWDEETEEEDVEDGEIIVKRPPTQDVAGFAAAPVAIDGEAAIEVTWDNSVLVDIEGLRIQIRRVSDSVIIADRVTRNPEDGEATFTEKIRPNKAYQVRARYLTISRKRKVEWTDWADGAVTTPGDASFYDTTAPAAVTWPGTPLTSTVRIEQDGTAVVELKAVWDASAATDFDVYDVQLKKGTGNWRSRRTDETEFEWIVQPNTSYSVRVRAIDKVGNKGTFSSTQTLTSATKTAAPDAPASITASPNLRGHYVTWPEVADNDLRRYEVYQHTAATPVPGTGTTPTRKIAAGTDYALFQGLSAGDTRYYWVRSVDRHGNKSAWTGPNSSAVSDDPDGTGDSTPPADAGTVTLSDSISTENDGHKWVKLIANWPDNADGDLFGYIVQTKETSGGDWTGRGVVEDSRFEMPVKKNTEYTVRVKAVDDSNNKSANWSTSSPLTTTSDTTAPPVPTITAIVAGFRNFRVSWNDDAEADKDFSHYELLQANSATPNYAGTSDEPGGEIKTRDNRYLYGGFGNAEQRWFWVRSVDRKGNKSVWSARETETTLRVDTGDLEDGAATTAKLDDGAATTEKIRERAVTKTYYARQASNKIHAVNTANKVLLSSPAVSKTDEDEIIIDFQFYGESLSGETADVAVVQKVETGSDEMEDVAGDAPSYNGEFQIWCERGTTALAGNQKYRVELPLSARFQKWQNSGWSRFTFQDTARVGGSSGTNYVYRIVVRVLSQTGDDRSIDFKQCSMIVVKQQR